MKLESKIFDSIRVKSAKKKSKVEEAPSCDHPGCERPGLHKAPKGRDREGEFFTFCVDHVREYNKSYNYFNGMGDNDVREYQKDSMTGHRPTWKMGGDKEEEKSTDFYDLRANMRGRAYRRSSATRKPRERKLLALEKRSLDVLNLGPSASSDDIKARYKELVKLNHPDANGGDRSSEDRLREIIQAYNVLKKAGFC
ncbi:MAG: J domain-containing protein [Rhodobacteraceae bacterium]|nr:J domain-containing protein [Paracoccaceae bacterium]